jgi:tRNA A-37 threonylcarbamoyl transferase component Bud32
VAGPGLIGSLVGGRYRVVRLLGDGSMGAVYLAEHEALLRPFAVKMLRRELATDQRFVLRFYREARAASRVQHPNIVYISDFGATADGSLFMVMEYIPGVTLRAELDRVGRLELPRALRLLVQVADALEAAHRAGVVHRDLKPENLVLTEHRGRPDFVKVLDFGLAKIVDPEAREASSITDRGEVLGTLRYLAPEQFQGAAAAPPADLYALGVTAFELLTGQTPFSGTAAELFTAHFSALPPPPSACLPGAGLPPAVDDIVGRCLAKRPEDRYATAGDLRDALRGLLKLVSGSGRVAASWDASVVGDTLRPGARLEGGPTAAHDAVGLAATLDAGGLAHAATVNAADDSGHDPRQAELERTVRELAEALCEHGFGGTALAVALGHLVQAEERHYAAQAEIALLESQVDETHRSLDDSEARLRQAIIQLTHQQVEIAGRAPGGILPGPVVSSAGGPAAGASTSGQTFTLGGLVADLERRMAELDRERRDRVAALEARLAEQRAAAADWAGRLKTETQVLRHMLRDLRGQVDAPEVVGLYLKLDEVG